MDEAVTLILDPETQLVTVNDDTPTISVRWDQAVQQAVINTAPGPTVASRAYGILHTAMFDAWAAYEDIPVATQLGDDLQRPDSENTEANKTEAMSYAAYGVLVDLFPSQTTIFDDLMADLGFDPNNTTTDTTTPAGIGNVTATALIDFRSQDGSNQDGTDANGDGTPYSDITGYQPVNQAGNIVDIEKWTPELVPIDANPGEEDRTQEFLTPHWGEVTPFGLTSGDQFRPVAPQPFLLVDGTVDLDAGTITLAADGSVVSITPDIVGTIINPEFINQTQEVIDYSANLTDEEKLIAEFWEDGGGTSFPPGTFMTFGQFVSARDGHSLDDDALLFFTLGNAVFDAGVATWEAKVAYDYARPVRLVRELGRLGLIGEFDADLNGFAIQAWSGPGEGTNTILATDFLTYQTPGSDPSPPFAEYTSGHSAFSAAGAQVLQLFTGSDDFGASVTFEPGESRFEPNVTPQSTVTLEWDTFTEAADEAGLSRLYGGIHFEEGDVNGRTLGREVGSAVIEQAQFYYTGGDINPSADLDQGSANSGVFSVSGLGATNLKATIQSAGSDFVNEVGFFTVDDANGAIGNLNPGDDGYLAAALERSQVLFSIIANTPTGFDHNTINRVIGNLGIDTNLAFYLITDGTTDGVLDDLTNDGITDTNVLLSTVSDVDISTIEEGFSLGWEDGGGDSESDVVVSLQTTVESITTGTDLQGNGENEFIDLSSQSSASSISVNVYREANYNNFVGLYRVDANGAVTNPDNTDELINPTEANRINYAQAAIANRLTGLDLTGSEGETTVFASDLEAGAIYAPFIVANGDLSSIADDFSNVYFPFLELNSDGFDHIRLLGNNVFGFEDLANGGDNDFNDLIVEINFV